MKQLSSCKLSIERCLETKTFSIAHLYKEENAMDIHIHNCYEIYYSIYGGKQFLIDNSLYKINPGDLFLINQYESHKLTSIDEKDHERIVISIYPDYVKKLSTSTTNLDYCFSERNCANPHKISLTKEQQNQFLYFIHRLTQNNGYGSDIIDNAIMMELLVFINKLYSSNNGEKIEPNTSTSFNQIKDILAYINENIKDSITINDLSQNFHLSESYISRIFRLSTGTTINKYINSRRLNIAKASLNNGKSVMEAFSDSGFADYSNFYKSFTKTVGLSPSKYAKFSTR